MKNSSPFSSFESERKNDNVMHRRRSPIPMRYIIPNIITILAICAGMNGIRLAFENCYESAILVLLLAAILDGADGRVARLMDGTSSFGAQMDSLADVINFGVTPALVVYSFILTQAHQVGWVAALVYCVACCLRLARFNVMLEDADIPEWQKNYFIGIPAPAGALMLLLPIYLGGIGLVPNWGWALFFSFYTLVIAFLLVSRLPVWSGKTIGHNLRRDIVIPCMLAIVIYVGFLATYMWYTLLITVICYMAFLPYSAWIYNKRAALEGKTKNIIDS
ncbi:MULTISPECIES: CDP-alcohol phosphatidyltransferase family protein [unclassified Bartonella]|uniref:CDP-alcohol phosphatidyltransferase family protein n=1 Tax=unclassified Bartonella TaxID=2645622 RepID=UPI00099A6546|nr:MULTISPECIES: phosphatidylcholine/phosphatidylserine synthase [unclassified Bartonella]AQX27797.1 CDP-diacylglycerol---serine O-phosphatidyltransferase [Bartonella sp. JB15]AQX29079.1 CDP-diacylglycerol---serine O-phosphatidyltransferase [Bartonella sp. JB63]